MIDVYKKENFVCLVCAFPENLLPEVENLLKKQNVKYRLVKNPSKWWEDFELVFWYDVEISRQEVVETKQKIMKL